MTIEFHVPGVPQPGGSKRGFPYKDKKTGKIRVAITDSNPKHATTWRASVQGAAKAAIESVDDLGFPLTCPIRLTVTFVMPRPKSHYRSGKNSHLLKKSAPNYHTKRPDTTKLLRSLEDALTHVIWADDSQIVDQISSKIYHSSGQDFGVFSDSEIGAHVRIQTLSE